jgi:SP family sugar:H+ symporter-like MFS transporter
MLQSFTTLGTAIGAFYGGKVIKIGRRKAAIYISIVATLVVIPTLFLEFWTICFFKFLWGCCCGMFGVMTARMIEETFPFHLSSVGGCMTNTSYGLGAMISIVLGLVLPGDHQTEELKKTEMWRVIFGFPMVLSITVLILFLFVFTHDSPKFYLSVGDEEKARFAIRKFYNTQVESEDEILAFLKSSCVKDTSSTTLTQALTDKKYRMGTWVCLILIFYHEIVGINVVLAYSHRILSEIDPTGKSLNPKTGTIIIGIINFVTTVCSIPFVIKFPRKTLLLWGHFFIFVFHTLAAIFSLAEMPMWELIMMNLFIAAYEFSSGTVCWIYIAEVVVDSALGLSVMTLFGTVFFLNLFVEFLIDSPSFGFAGVFMSMGIFSLTGSIFVYFYMRETKGLTDRQKKELYMPKEFKKGAEEVVEEKRKIMDDF